jgi:serine/threonine protein kinase
VDGDQQPEAPLVGRDLGRYRLESALGEGGMAHVYRAVERTSGHKVAVKVLREGKSPQPQLRERFEREWRVMQEITHPNVVAVLDWPDDPIGPLYYVMELLEGETLGQRLEREGRLSHDEAMSLFEQLAKGLVAVHDAGSVHRDIKPQNVFLCRVPESARGTRVAAKILDFGLARVFGSQITGSGVIVGTPAYVSPEQAAGDRVDPRSDVYALGLVMYRALTGHHPFTSDDQVATLGHQLLSPPPPLSWLEESVPAALEALVLQMLRKKPDDRPQTMLDVLHELAAIDRTAHDAPPSARMTNPPNDRYGPLNPLAEGLVKNALRAKGFRPIGS